MGNYDVLLPVIDETTSLKKTVDQIMSFCEADINRIIIITAPKTTFESHLCIEEIIKNYQNQVLSVVQETPGLGGALRDGFNLSKAKHIVMMASDLETDPRYLPGMIGLSKEFPRHIVTGNRWMNKIAGFEGYGVVKMTLNYIFQKLLRVLYNTNLSDLTYGYRIYPAASIENLSWHSTDHSFLLESLLLPIKMKCQIIEFPMKWKSRTEGKSHIEIKSFVNYIKVALRLRFSL